jgi:signal transduction histidine kinase
MRLLRPHRHDVWIAVAGLAGGLLGLALDLYTFRPHGDPRWVLLGLAAMCAAELMRRSAPVLALCVAVPALVADTLTGGLLAVVVMFTDVVYAAVLYGGARASRNVLVLSVVTTVGATVAFLAATRQPEGLILGALCAGITVVPAGTAVIVRDHREAAAAERLRAEQTALLAEMDRVQAVTAERSRMARELHDVIAGHLTAIAIHSTAALSLHDRAAAGEGTDGGPGDEDATRTALTVIRENSTQGLAEMRRLIGLLRESGEDQEVPESAPSLDGVDALVRRAEQSGAASQLTFTLRDERGDAPKPPAPIELAAYRIVQESLTNAVKHASPGEVTVELRQHEAALTITVTSPLDARRAAGPRAPGARAGVTGMRERVALLGGSFEAGPADGCWRVRAELPTTEGTAQQ